MDPSDIRKGTNSKFFLKKVKSSDILMKLTGVNIAKATGHNKISNKLLKLAAPVIYQALVDFFNLSIKLNTFPTDWKIVKIFPLFKNGECSNPCNYRPTSVLPTIAQIYAYFIEPRQSGLRSLYSTVTALLDMTNHWCFNTHRGMVSGVIILDLKKAFDTVDHDLLLRELKHYGVQGATLAWFKSYLTGRQQFYVANGVSSGKSICFIWFASFSPE